ncbi:glucose-1-phosphate thymidylyltransferase [Nonomuraea sp. NPDC059007]|uniref:glucose-1-phosphate thymidylyltransferase n=1 Tax=Nonomuraea sp. NPDC059007 TaxID=3346692 RepID=UPI0036B42FD2
MKALVLAGGLGTRLRPLTHTMPKQLIPVANKPVLHYGLRAIKDADITDVGIVVDGHDDHVRRAIGNGSAFGLNVSYIPQDAPSGLAHCVLIAREFLGDADFVMYLGDNIVMDGIVALRDDFLTRRPAAMVMTGKVLNPTDFGIAEVDTADRIVRLEEKPKVPRSDLAVIGAYAFSPAIHQAVRSVTPNWRHEREITDALTWLIDHGFDVNAHPVSGYWKDAGRIDDLLDCNREVLGTIQRAVHGNVGEGSELIGPVVVETGASVLASRIVGPAIIGADASVVRSTVGPCTSIGPDCEVMDTTIENSILLTGASLRGVRGISASVIGRSARVHARSAPERRLILGDDSKMLIEP